MIFQCSSSCFSLLIIHWQNSVLLGTKPSCAITCTVCSTFMTLAIKQLFIISKTCQNAEVKQTKNNETSANTTEVSHEVESTLDAFGTDLGFPELRDFFFPLRQPVLDFC